MTYADRLSWLFGKRSVSIPDSTSNFGAALFSRGMILDVEDLDDAARAIVAALDAQSGSSSTRAVFRVGSSTVEAADLGGLSVPERNSLVLDIQSANGGSSIMGFIAATSIWNVWALMPSLALIQAMHVGIDTLAARGTPRLDARGLAPLLAWFPAAVAWASYVALMFSVSLPPAAHVLVSTLLLGFTGVTWAWWSGLHKKARAFATPTIFRGESRKETYARRADHRRDWRIGIQSALGALLAGLVLGFIWWALSGTFDGSGS